MFRADVGNEDVALRCFTREAREQRLRYRALHTHLAGSIPPYMVDFTYRDREIRVAGECIQSLRWAGRGAPLHLRVEQHLGIRVTLSSLPLCGWRPSQISRIAGWHTATCLLTTAWQLSTLSR